MQVLIIGGAGEIGRYLMKEFAQRGHEVTVLDRVISPEIGDLSIHYLQGNLTDAIFVKEAVKGKDVIIHLAWSFADDAPTIFGEDIRGHIHLLEAASSSKIRSLIYTSTATVYGRAVVHPVMETHPCLIEEARKPLYALGKYAAEELCMFYYRERKVPVTIFRFWWAFGDSIGGRHLRDLVKKALNNQPLEMVRGAGGAFATMIDLAGAIALAIEKPTASGKIYNMGSLFLTWEEIVNMVVRLTCSSSALKFIPSDQWKGPAFLNEVWDLSWEKAERELGYQPQSSKEEMRSQFMGALESCIAQVRGSPSS